MYVDPVQLQEHRQLSHDRLSDSDAHARLAHAPQTNHTLASAQLAFTAENEPLLDLAGAIAHWMPELVGTGADDVVGCEPPKTFARLLF